MASASGNQEIARRYATALFELAKEQGQVDGLAGDLSSLGKAATESPDFTRLMTNAALKRPDQARALLAVADAMQLSSLTKNFLGTVAAKGRLAALPAIIAAVQAEIAKHKGEVTAEVTSAHTLDQAQVDAIAAGLKKALGATVKINLTEDAGILGGLVIRVGSKLIDSSVRSKLERLARALKSQDTSTDKKKMKEVA